MPDGKKSIEHVNNLSARARRKFTTEPESIIPYHPQLSRRVITARLDALEIINERFALKLNHILFDFLRRSADVNMTSLKIHSFEEYVDSQNQQAYQCLIDIAPLQGKAIFNFSSTLLTVLVENLFGGDGSSRHNNTERNLSATELRIMRKFTAMALPHYDGCWQSICDIKSVLVRTESKINLAPITSSVTDNVVTASFDIKVGKLSGQLDICLSYKMLEPIIEKLMRLPREISLQEQRDWDNHLRQKIKNTQIDLIANIHDNHMRLSDVLELNVGDVIPIAKQDVINCSAHDFTVLSARYGCSAGRYALQVESVLNTALHCLEKEFSTNE